MSAISDKIAEANADADAALQRSIDFTAKMEAEVKRLQDLVDAGGATQADLDNLDALRLKLAQIDPTDPTTLKQ